MQEKLVQNRFQYLIKVASWFQDTKNNKAMIRTIVLIFFFLIAGNVHAKNDSPEDWTITKELFSQTPNCDDVWQFLWPKAKAGNTKARYLLASMMVGAGISPPGSKNTYITNLKNVFIMMVHASVIVPPEETKGYLDFKEQLLLSADFLPALGKRYKKCLTKNKSREECITELVASHVIPSFESYAQEIDALAESGNEPASCECKGRWSSSSWKCHPYPKVKAVKVK